MRPGTRWLIAGLAVLLFSVSVARAQPSEDVRAAAALWLAGDDATSLPRLAELARAGDAEARLLLGRIATEDLGPSPFRVSLPRTAARALFREEAGGAFGRSWLVAEAAAGHALAQTLLEAMRPVPRLDVIRRLHALGEDQATDHAVRIVALYGSAEMKAELMQDPALLPELRPYLAYLFGRAEPRGDGLAALRHIAPGLQAKVVPTDAEVLGLAGYLALGLGFGEHVLGETWRAPVHSWLLTAPEMRPLARLCQGACGDEAGDCAFAFLGLSGGYFEAIRYDSPLETVIPQDAFLESPRARQMILRRAVLARTETNLGWLSDHPALREISACAADLVEAIARQSETNGK
ncbi:MAG: hypothetical protein AAFY59_12800, partial [Pseudomonadota bacterium]